MPTFADIDNDPTFQASITTGQNSLPNGGVYQGPSTPISDGPSSVQTTAPNVAVGNSGGVQTTAPASAWSPGSGQAITAQQVTAQYGADPSVAQYWADKINTGGDPNYYVSRLQQDNAGTGPDGRGGVSGGGAAGGYGASVSGPDPAMAAQGVATAQAAGGGARIAAPTVPAITAAQQPYQYSNYTAPAAFQAPTLQDAENAPGYQFALGQGEQAIQNSAAARGVLNTGGTLKDLNNYAQQAATQDYQNVYNNALQTYTTNAGIGFQTNQANNAGNLNAFTANLGAQDAAANVALQQGSLANQAASIQNQYALGLGGLALGGTQTANQYALGQGQLGLGYLTANNANSLNWANYGLNANAQQFYQDYGFPVSAGLQATGQLNSAAGQYGQTGSNLITGAGNAAAAGTVGGANAWNQAAGGIANTAQGLAYLYSYQ